MSYFIHFLPIILFITLFVGSGIYFSAHGVANAFYQLSPITAIIPAIVFSWILHKGNNKQKMHDLLDGIRHRDIITMCFIFLLAGAFSEITKNIGSIESIVNFALSIIPVKFLLIGLFLISAFIATSIGTSMGTIATIAPIASMLSNKADLNLSLSIATVVGGAMFGDNLSIISDTTIASVMSQEADMRKKLILNSKIAGITAIITVIFLFFYTKTSNNLILNDNNYSLLLITPYIVLLLLAISGINVFVALLISIFYAGIIGFIHQPDYGILIFSKQLNQGFASMQEIMLLSLLVGGLSGLSSKYFTKEVANNISTWITNKNAGNRSVQFVIATLVSIFDILLANNTIAIIFSGEIARDISRKQNIPAHYSAAWLDIFSCVFQGIIPYGAQLLLASSIACVSPLTIVPYVYYCYLLGLVSILYITFIKINQR